MMEVISREPKVDQNALPADIDPISNPASLSIIDRYIFASHWCKNKKVLDASCGYGVGTNILKALGAGEVTGTDIDEVALRYASGNNNHIEFFNMDLTKPVKEMGFKDNYDVVVSIETMEHLPKESVVTYLNNLKAMTRKGGKVIITSPIRTESTFNYIGGTHLYEYNTSEFKELLNSVFDLVEFNSIFEFAIADNGLLHSELIKGIMDNSKLFFAVCEVE